MSKQLEQAIIAANTNRGAYIQFFNDYLTIEKFAEHREIPVSKAKRLINKGKAICLAQYGFICEESRISWSKHHIDYINY